MTVLRTHLIPVTPVLETELDRVPVELVHIAPAVPPGAPQSPILGAPKNRSSSLCLMLPAMEALYLRLLWPLHVRDASGVRWRPAVQT